LLNDAVMIDTSQTLGKQMAARKGAEEERIKVLFQRVLTRPANEDELKLLASFLDRQRVRLQKKELDAATIAGPGEGDANERAVWTTLARALLNLDEAITR
jgi:hypothetical protein